MCREARVRSPHRVPDQSRAERALSPLWFAPPPRSRSSNARTKLFPQHPVLLYQLLYPPILLRDGGVQKDQLREDLLSDLPLPGFPSPGASGRERHAR